MALERRAKLGSRLESLVISDCYSVYEELEILRQSATEVAWDGLTLDRRIQFSLCANSVPVVRVSLYHHISYMQVLRRSSSTGPRGGMRAKTTGIATIALVLSDISSPGVPTITAAVSFGQRLTTMTMHVPIIYGIRAALLVLGDSRFRTRSPGLKKSTRR